MQPPGKAVALHSHYRSLDPTFEELTFQIQSKPLGRVKFGFPPYFVRRVQRPRCCLPGRTIDGANEFTSSRRDTWFLGKNTKGSATAYTTPFYHEQRTLT